jgi:hypothetical protein
VATPNTCIINPWDTNRITWGDPFADGDREAFTKMGWLKNQKKSASLDFYTLPEPYCGDINSPVYCLNMNPGAADPLFKDDLILLLLTWLTLQHSLPFVFWANPCFANYVKIDGEGKYHSHGGCKWFASRTKDLRISLGDVPNLFMIEYFPYHSNHGFEFPSWLPSYAYTNELIEKAMEKGKFIVIMRQKERWFKRIPKLKNYKPLAFLEYGQGGWLSKGDLIYKSNAFSDLVAALKTENNNNNNKIK